MSRSDLRWTREPRRGLPVGRQPRCPPRQGGAETGLRRTPRTGRLPACLVKAQGILQHKRGRVVTCPQGGASTADRRNRDTAVIVDVHLQAETFAAELDSLRGHGLLLLHSVQVTALPCHPCWPGP